MCRGVQAGATITLVVLTCLTIIGAFMLSTFQWTPVRHDGNLIGRTISPVRSPLHLLT